MNGTDTAPASSSPAEPLERAFKRAASVILRPFFRSASAGPVRSFPVRNILVVRQHDQLGDMLCAVPLLRALRNAFVDARITLVCSPVNYQIMLHHPYADEVIEYNKASLRRSPAGFAGFRRSIRQAGMDLAIVPATVSLSMTSDVIARLSGARIRVGASRLGNVSNPTSYCFTHRAELDWSAEPHRHQTLRNLDVLRPLGIEESDLTCTIGITKTERDDASEFLRPLRSRSRFLIGMHPGAGKEQNRWPAVRFAALAGKLASGFGAGIVVTAGHMDDAQLRIVKEHIACPHVIVQNQSIRRVAAVIDQTDFFVSNDTGIMHVAGATRAGLLSLFGRTDPLQWAPIGGKNRFVVADDGDLGSLSEARVFDELSSMIRDSCSPRE